MACNCATTEQINELYRRYGDKSNKKKMTFKDGVKYYFMHACVVIALIPIVPVLFLYVLYKAICDDDHKISLKKFFRLDKQIVLNGGK